MGTTGSLWSASRDVGTSTGEYWVSACPLTTLEAALNNPSYVPAYATITKVKLYVSASMQSSFGSATQVYIRYGFGGTESISKELVGSTKVLGGANQNNIYDYPEGGLDITSYLSNKVAPNVKIKRDYGQYLAFGFSSSNFVGKKQYYIKSVKLEITYTIPNYKVSLVASPSEGGTVSGEGTYQSGTSVTLTATPKTGYKFVQWNDGNTSATRTITVTGNATYTATFEKLKYTVTWKNHDGTTLETDNNVEYGTTPSYNGATPTKASTAQHSYTFSGWSPTVSAVTGDVTYTAQFTATVRKYTVRWFNYDGTLLETDTDVPYGTKPTYNGATPTKPSDDYYTYGFAGWSPSIEEGIQGDKDFTAQFAQVDRYYTVRWVNASAVQGVEGTLLETDEVKFDTQPDYNGATPKHPKQDTDPALNYDFIGWSAKVTDPAKPDTELETVKGDITYTAIYETTPKLYAITVVLFDGQSTTDIYEYGTEVTIEAPDVTGYKFVKWSDGDTRQSRTVTVTGEATYQAVYKKLSLITLVASPTIGGTITGATNGYYDYEETPELTITAIPAKGYKFVAWKFNDDDASWLANPISFSVDDYTITAIFEKAEPEITLVQMLYQGRQISETNKVPAEEYFRIVVAAVAHD